MRLAYFSPLPPQPSGIADYSAELLPYLAQRADVTLFTSDPDQTAIPLRDMFDIQATERFPSLASEFDLPLYHIGNSEFHDEISRLALRYPGVIVLHDFFLHHAVAQRTAGKGDLFTYAREMGYERGAEGIRRAMAVRHGLQAPLFEVPLNGRLLDVSLGVIVHSKYAGRLVRGQRYKGPLAVIAHLMSQSQGRSRRSELNLPESAILFGSFGLLTAEKQIVRILGALQMLRRDIPDAHYLLVGGALPEVALEAITRDLGLGEAVHHAGHVSALPDFIDWIHTADVVINLRYPTVGETSGTALRAMAAAKPLIVNDIGWYDEIPSGAALKISPDGEQVLVQAMRTLGSSATLRKRMGNAGLTYIHSACQPEDVANAYIEELTRIQTIVGIDG